MFTSFFFVTHDSILPFILTNIHPLLTGIFRIRRTRCRNSCVSYLLYIIHPNRSYVKVLKPHLSHLYAILLPWTPCFLSLPHLCINPPHCRNIFWLRQY